LIGAQVIGNTYNGCFLHDNYLSENECILLFMTKILNALAYSKHCLLTQLTN